MDFERFHALLIGHLRERVRGGEISERALARLVGISQPHLHNVLKGERSLSFATADRILHLLHLGLEDLIDSR